MDESNTCKRNMIYEKIQCCDIFYYKNNVSSNSKLEKNQYEYYLV